MIIYFPAFILFKVVVIDVAVFFVNKYGGWLVVFYDISTFVGYLTPDPFLKNNLFYFKQFSLAWVQILIVKNISISSYSV